jgi:glycosyltransferase involved in cell wall biosynthesis
MRKLCEQHDITVISIKKNGFENNFERFGYNYYEIYCFNFFGLKFQPKLLYYIFGIKWDRIICSWNIRHFDRFCYFLLYRSRKTKWIWWGHILGRSDFRYSNLVRKIFISMAKSTLIYSDYFRYQLLKEYHYKNIYSFNNSELSIEEVRKPIWKDDFTLNLLFVGRYSKRKNLNFFIEIAKLNKNLNILLIGPGMVENFKLIELTNFKVLDKIENDKLDSYFNWCHLVVNPGLLGLLISNASRYGKPILINKIPGHGPEISLAYDSNQLFHDFSDIDNVSKYLNYLKKNIKILQNKGIELQQTAIKKYNIEYMSKIHLKCINDD